LDLKRVGLNIKNRRLALGLHQHDIHSKSGITQQKISNIELGNNPNPSVNTLQRIADALNCDLVDLLSCKTEFGSDSLNL